MPQYVVLYGYNVDKKGRLRPDGIARCEKAYHMARWLGSDAVIVFCVDRTLMPNVFGETMRRLEGLGWSPEQIITTTSAVDTLGETRCAYSFIRHRSADTVYVVTSAYHMRRVIAMWKYVGFKGTIIPCPSAHSETPIPSWLHEQGAFIKFFLRRRLFA